MLAAAIVFKRVPISKKEAIKQILNVLNVS